MKEGGERRTRRGGWRLEDATEVAATTAHSPACAGLRSRRDDRAVDGCSRGGRDVQPRRIDVAARPCRPPRRYDVREGGQRAVVAATSVAFWDINPPRPPCRLS